VTSDVTRGEAATASAPTSGSAGPLDVIEVATAMLVRNFELLRRRSDVYAELDRAEYLLLRILYQAGPSDICSLATALGLDPSTAGRQVVAMEAKSLVRRAPAGDDRRRTIITPTEEGRCRMAATRTRRSEETARLLADWSDDDLRSLAAMFTRYNQALARRYLTASRTDRAPPAAATEVLLPEA
jgi:DNA-binding MarR family transcriptional regulator